MVVNFTVTDKIIDESMGSCSKNCAVANVINEVLSDDLYASVGPSYLNIVKMKGEVFKSFNVSPVGMRFILLFDLYKRGKARAKAAEGLALGIGPARPALISFQLDLPEDCLKLEVVESIKNSGIKGAVAIVEQQAALLDRLVSV